MIDDAEDKDALLLDTAHFRGSFAEHADAGHHDDRLDLHRIRHRSVGVGTASNLPWCLDQRICLNRHQRNSVDHIAERLGPRMVDIAAMIDDAVVFDELDLILGFNPADLDRRARDRSGGRQRPCSPWR